MHRAYPADILHGIYMGNHLWLMVDAECPDSTHVRRGRLALSAVRESDPHSRGDFVTDDDQAKAVAKEITKAFAKQRRHRQGNLQGCGCILIVLGLLAMTLTLPLLLPLAPFATLLIVVGIVVLILGFF
jgi:hypothetical protein